MGSIISAVVNTLFGKKSVNILMVGLDGVGKTTILYKLKLGEVVTTIPTIGFNVETVEYKNISFTVWDVVGGDKLRKLWWHYLEGCNGLIFVVDSNDRDRIEDVRPDLYSILEHPYFREKIMLVFANKQDIPNYMSTDEITDKLGLNTLKNIKWHVQATCAIQGNGLYEGLDWLSNELTKTTKQLKVTHNILI